MPRAVRPARPLPAIDQTAETVVVVAPRTLLLAARAVAPWVQTQASILDNRRRRRTLVVMVVVLVAVAVVLLWDSGWPPVAAGAVVVQLLLGFLATQAVPGVQARLDHLATPVHQVTALPQVHLAHLVTPVPML